MKLNNLKPAEGSTKTRKRIGRGPGSGLGGTSTRGHKGAKSRSMMQNRQEKSGFSTAGQKKTTKSNKNARKGR